MAVEPSPEFLRELRVLRMTLLALVVVVAVYVGLQIPALLAPRPSGNSQELRAIQAELRVLRDEVGKLRQPPVQPPVVAPAGKVGKDK